VPGKHLLFITRPSGYELAEREGDPPAPGDAKVAPSPLPDDDRPCAYLQAVS
jgi:hypothetical protein